MASSYNLLDNLQKQGYTFFSGVPCSYMKSFINSMINYPNIQYIAASSEGEAVGISAGAWLAGKKGAILCQNSGLGNIVNPATSLLNTFAIPLLLFVSWRGNQNETTSTPESQHLLMGKITLSLLKLLDIPYNLFDIINAPDLLSNVDKFISQRQSYALVLTKESLNEKTISISHTHTSKTNFYSQETVNLENKELPSRLQIIKSVCELATDKVLVIATTGMTARELYSVQDKDEYFYMVGSMGCASAIGLGVSLNTGCKVVVLDGDGAALMKLGNLSTIGAYQPNNFIHIILNNHEYDSTGGQLTNAFAVSFGRLAINCSYKSAYICGTASSFCESFHNALKHDGPHLIDVRIRTGSEKVGRPFLDPKDNALRFRKKCLSLSS